MKNPKKFILGAIAGVILVCALGIVTATVQGNKALAQEQAARAAAEVAAAKAHAQ